MKLAIVLVIARKELMDVLRDRRTLLFMMLLPLVLMPVLVVVGGKFLARTARESAEKVLDVAVTPGGDDLLRELGQEWKQAHGPALMALQVRLGLELGGVEDVFAWIGGADDADDDTPSASADDAVDDEAPAPLSLDAMARLLEPRERQLLEDAQAIDDFLQRTTFVPLDELAAATELRAGVEVPEGLPPELADPRVAAALQDKAIAAAVSVPLELLTMFDVDRVSQSGGAVRLETQPTTRVHAVYDGSQPLSERARDRLDGFVAALDRYALRARLDTSRLDDDFVRPVRLESGNVATASRQFQGAMGGILPYMLFSFCFFGALYPALDITAGEKERFTLETLLLGPISRAEIAVGKFVVVFLGGLVAAILSTASLIGSITYGLLPPELLARLDLQVEPMALVLTATLLVPIAAMYAALLLAVGLYARSFKEAQSYTVPLQLILLIPMLVSFIPDLEAKGGLAWVPFVNVAMLLRELLKGETPWMFYGITLASTLVLTVGSLVVASAMFRRESVLLRA